MAAFGRNTENIFTDTMTLVNSIFFSARMLAVHYWPQQGNVFIQPDQSEQRLKEMHRHEGVLWDTQRDVDEVRQKLEDIQTRLETVTRPVFEESMRSFSILTRRRW